MVRGGKFNSMCNPAMGFWRTWSGAGWLKVYPLVNVDITMKNHHVSWLIPQSKWACSIAIWCYVICVCLPGGKLGTSWDIIGCWLALLDGGWYPLQEIIPQRDLASLFQSVSSPYIFPYQSSFLHIVTMIIYISLIFTIILLFFAEFSMVQ